jgi:hypothetical protein
MKETVRPGVTERRTGAGSGAGGSGGAGSGAGCWAGVGSGAGGSGRSGSSPLTTGKTIETKSVFSGWGIKISTTGMGAG